MHKHLTNLLIAISLPCYRQIGLHSSKIRGGGIIIVFLESQNGFHGGADADQVLSDVCVRIVSTILTN